MRIGSEKGLSRLAETLEMHLMADAVAGLGHVYAVRQRDRLDICVIVGVELTGLEHIVIDIRNAALRLYLVGPYRFELQVRHRTGGVLRESLVYTDGYLRSRYHFAGNKMLSDEFLSKIHNRSVPLGLGFSAAAAAPQGKKSGYTFRSVYYN